MKYKYLIFILLWSFPFVQFAQKHRNITQTVRFSESNYEIPPEESALLKVFIDMIQQMPDYNFMVQAQASNIYAPTLINAARNRAKQVKQFLVEHGVENDKITMLEIAQSLPDDDTEEAANRKFQVMVFGYFLDEDNATNTKDNLVLNPPKVEKTIETTDEKGISKTTEYLAEKEKGVIISSIEPEDTLITQPEFSFHPPKKAGEMYAEWEKMENENRIENSYLTWDIEPQTFVIFPEKDTLLETIRGLFIYIPAYSFQTKGVQTMGRDIHFIIREYLKKSDMATFYIGSQNDAQNISASGIYRMEATSDDIPLEIKPNHQIYAMFPQVLTSPDVVMYAGKRSDSNFQILWERQTQSKGNMRTQVPIEWQEAWKSGWFISDSKKEENFISYIRKRYRLTKEQAQVLAYTMISQDEYEKSKKKWDKTDKYPPVHPSSAYIFGVQNMDKVIMFGKNKVESPMALLRVQYPQKKNVAFQLISKHDKSLSYPSYLAANDTYTFKAYKEEEYVLLGVKYIHNKVQLSLQSLKVNDNQMEINNVQFLDYENFRDAKKALRMLDY